MHNSVLRIPFSTISLGVGAVAVLLVIYIALIAIVMSYATLTIEFSQSVRNNESVVASLESQYLASVVRTTTMDYVAAGYFLPVAKIFVPAKSVTALR